MTRTLRSYLNSTDSGRGMDVQRTEVTVWTTPASAATAKVSTEDVSLDGRYRWSTVYREQSTPVTTRIETTLPSAGAVDETTSNPDNSSIQKHFVNGRPVSVGRRNSSGTPVSQTSYAYDSHGRQWMVTDSHSGTITNRFNNADLVVAISTPARPDGVSETTSTEYDNCLRPIRIVYPDGAIRTNEYNVNGLVRRVLGARTYPVAYSYDAQGRMRTMSTWQDARNGAPTTTTWNYSPTRGWLSSKRYADGRGPDYFYSPGGRLRVRQWARSGVGGRVTTTYTYGFNNSGGATYFPELTGVAYSYEQSGVSTPAATYGYDRRGRRVGTSFATAAGVVVRTDAFNDADLPGGESYSGGSFNGLTVSASYDTSLRRAGLTVNTSPALSTTYGYDTAGRLGSVTAGAYSATYGYVADSSLIGQVTFKNGASPKLTTARSYDNLGRMQSVASSPSNDQPVTYGYQHNLAGQRSRVTLGDGSYWTYRYDKLGQVISGQKFFSDGSPVPGYQFDGWNLVAEVDVRNSQQPVLVRGYVWGLDVSGTLQGAGGVGGLLGVLGTSGGLISSCDFPAYDANGNLLALVSAGNGTCSARYEYGPFGEVLRATGPMAKANPFRFSTKYQDDKTDLVYYGYRYYNAGTGRWLSRDALGENGFYAFYRRDKHSTEAWPEAPPVDDSSYLFVVNSPIGNSDMDGCRTTPTGDVAIDSKNRRSPPGGMKLIKVPKCTILFIYGHNYVGDFEKQGVQWIWNIVPANDKEKDCSYAAVAACSADRVPNEIPLSGYKYSDYDPAEKGTITVSTLLQIWEDVRNKFIPSAAQGLGSCSCRCKTVTSMWLKIGGGLPNLTPDRGTVPLP